MINNGYFFVIGNHLALYRPIENLKAYWENHWQQINLEKVLQVSKSGYLGEFEQPFLKYLPKGGPILEAGCGTGKWVSALRTRGYEIEGIDYAEDTLAEIKKIDPSLRVSKGDIYAINKPDGYYSAYLSTGVLEHNLEGPLKGLLEARRVLSSQGVALISVPYINCPRARIYHHISNIKTIPLPENAFFYQYYFSISNFLKFLKAADFEVSCTFPYEVYTGLTRDNKLGQWLHQRRFFHYRIYRHFRKWCQNAPGFARYRWAHMVMYICKVL